MNELNYASLEASKRLVKKEIVLETDAFWRNLPVDARCRDSAYEWNLGFDRINGCYEKSIPAPSMAEVWRELPSDTLLVKGKEASGAWTLWPLSLPCQSINPTDALIDLLIWMKENKHD